MIIITESDCESHFSMTSNSDDQDCDDDHFLKSDGTDNDDKEEIWEDDEITDF